MDSRERGLKRIKEVLGDQILTALEPIRKVSPDFLDIIVRFGYGELYSRKGFTDKERELVAVTSLISQGKTGLPLKAHVQGMLNAGWKKEEIVELIIFVSGFVGFPTAVEAMQTVGELFEKF